VSIGRTPEQAAEDQRGRERDSAELAYQHTRDRIREAGGDPGPYRPPRDVRSVPAESPAWHGIRAAREQARERRTGRSR